MEVSRANFEGILTWSPLEQQANFWEAPHWPWRTATTTAKSVVRVWLTNMSYHREWSVDIQLTVTQSTPIGRRLIPGATWLQHFRVWVWEHLLAASWLSVRFWMSSVGRAAARAARAMTETILNCIFAVEWKMKYLN